MKKVFVKYVVPGLVAATLVGCGGGDKPNIELIQDFMESPALKAQEADETAPNGIGNRVPPSNTVPVGFKPYAHKGDLAGADKMINPFADSTDSAVVMKGQKVYETHCMVCHGQKGKGDGPVSVKMALKPPSVLSDKVKGWTDGHIYHVITEGQGLMNPYAAHVPQDVRWQLVNYIRFLQKNSN